MRGSGNKDKWHIEKKKKKKKRKAHGGKWQSVITVLKKKAKFRTAYQVITPALPFDKVVPPQS